MDKVDDLEFGVQIEHHGKHIIVKMHRTIMGCSSHTAFGLDQNILCLDDKQYEKLINYLESFFTISSHALNDHIKSKLTRE